MFIAREFLIYPAPSGAECKLKAQKAHSAPLERTRIGGL
jgi:hypothetical protein